MTFLSDSALDRLREAADAPDLEGTRYRLLGRLGEGGMGGVFRVEDVTLEREVALKVLHLDDRGGTLSARLLQEARVIARLEHPGIVPVHDAGSLSDGRPYYTMKLVQGRRLDEHVANAGLSDRLRIFLRICDPVAFAHAHGVLHRDLKPANVMVGPFGEVLVMDWGLSKLLATAKGSATQTVPQSSISTSTTNGQTAHGSVLGTPGYMSPEQRRGETSIDQRADIYSLGAILEFLLQGAAPRPAPRALAPSAGRQWQRIVTSGTRPFPNWRRMSRTLSMACPSEPILKDRWPRLGVGPFATAHGFCCCSLTWLRGLY